MKFTLLMLTRAYILYSYTQYLNTKFLYIFYTKTRGNGSEFLFEFEF